MKKLLIVVLLLLPGVANAAPSKQVQAMMHNFDSLNEVCMSDDAEKPNIKAACDKRDAIYARVSSAGWCFASYNLPMEQRRWRPCAAHARVMILAGNHIFKTGDTVPPENAVYHLYLDQPCQLPLADKRNVFAFTQTTGNQSRHGCWYPTMDDGFVIIYGSGEIDKQPSLRSLPRATINPDGSATITEVNYKTDEFEKRMMQEQSDQLLQKLRQGNY